MKAKARGLCLADDPATARRSGRVSLPPVIFVLVQADVSADGGVSSISQIIAGLRNHRPIIVTDRETERLERWRSAGIETHVIAQSASRGLSRDPLKVLQSYARYTKALRSIIRKSGSKIVHANDPMAFQLSLAAVKMSRGVKIALNIRDTLDPGRRPPRARFRFLFGAADHVFFLSNDMADRWAEVAPNAKSAFSATYSVVDPKTFAASPPYSGDGPPVVLISGLIWAKKGQLDFIRNVSPKLAREGIATWLSGDFDPQRSPYMAACAEAAEPLGKMVEFLGYRTDVPQLMARSAVVAVPSRHEGLVRAMIEAMSCARPVVSFDISSAREILEEQSGGAGVVVKSGDFDAMAEAIIRYCRDPALASAAGKKGRSAAAKLFAPEEVVARYESVYAMLESGS